MDDQLTNRENCVNTEYKGLESEMRTALTISDDRARLAEVQKVFREHFKGADLTNSGITLEPLKGYTANPDVINKRTFTDLLTSPIQVAKDFVKDTQETSADAAQRIATTAGKRKLEMCAQR